MDLEPKFGQTIHKTKSTYYNTATPRLQWNYSQNLVKLYKDKAYILQHRYSKAPVDLEPKCSQIIHKTSVLITTQLLQGSSGPRSKIWSNHTQDKRTYYNTATPRLQLNKSQIWSNYTKQSLHTTTQLLQGSSGTTAKTWSYYTQDKTYILQHSYFKAPVDLEPKFGQIKHKTKSAYYNTATPS